MKMIDHDPNEKSGPTSGETIFVTAATVIVVIALGTGLRIAFDELGYAVGVGICIALLIAMFAIAVWLDRRR